MIRGLIALFISALNLCVTEQSYGHEIKPGYLEITELTLTTQQMGREYAVKWKVPIREGLPLAVTPIFPSECIPQNNSEVTRNVSAVLTTIVLNCVSSLNGSIISLNGLDATLTDVIVRFDPLEGATQTRRATNDNPDVELETNPSKWDVAITYFVLGVEHIWFGFDHLLFVLGLVLLISGKWRVIKTITAFTIAHSVTLIATTLGWVSLSIEPVEAVIALSILFLAVEIIHKEKHSQSFTERKPWIISASFGLLHGFGFAGALSDIGMPYQDVPTALFTFNIGVEFGQVVFVLFLLFALYLIDQFRMRRPTEVLASYAIGSLSVFWLIERLI